MREMSKFSCAVEVFVDGVCEFFFRQICIAGVKSLMERYIRVRMRFIDPSSGGHRQPFQSVISSLSIRHVLALR